VQLQWKWDTYPICFLPKSLRGAEINNLDINGLHTCLTFITDEEQNAASTSYNFLEHGKGSLKTMLMEYTHTDYMVLNSSDRKLNVHT